jgi:hypothetical protein
MKCQVDGRKLRNELLKLYLSHYKNDQIMKDEMDGACSMREKCMHSFGNRASRDLEDLDVDGRTLVLVDHQRSEMGVSRGGGGGLDSSGSG